MMKYIKSKSKTVWDDISFCKMLLALISFDVITISKLLKNLLNYKSNKKWEYSVLSRYAMICIYQTVPCDSQAIYS